MAPTCSELAGHLHGVLRCEEEPEESGWYGLNDIAKCNSLCVKFLNVSRNYWSWGEYLGPKRMRMVNGESFTMREFKVCTIPLIQSVIKSRRESRKRIISG